eukprot:CAMPEP_0167805814 /NCGR_PEP_ID=MMETSP0111_2-20121227/21423_1 /TAXON_ID=91324 /ORGANISM="Lotharella globosa, Strain CCCM811" /LENGTH=212 /DNA_ID=CAMNT_0007703081 /DNA_START=193 /DNA_END=831 /DNA_ORIENTATION=+
MAQKSIETDAPLGFDKRHQKAFVDYDNGRPSVTRVESVRYNPQDNTSLVLCYPLTGRQHQIRAHLNHLNHPIANDVKYGGSTERVEVITAYHHTNTNTNTTNTNTAAAAAAAAASSKNRTSGGGGSNALASTDTDKNSLLSELEGYLDLQCPRCSWVVDALSDVIPVHQKPKVLSGIWLHSLRYEFPNLNRTFKATAPSWATELLTANDQLP